MAEPLYLLDGTLLFFRALYGMPDVFQDDAGRSINGVRGYLAFLTGLLTGRGGQPAVAHCAVAFDESLASCWRNAHYPEYKANRPPADEATLYQLALCRAVTEALGVPVLADEAYEADDYIATLARLSRRPVVIVSRDKDLQQLLSGRVSLLDPKDNSLATVETFSRAFGFPPHVFPDYQALTGDSVDNVPGVAGIGPKSARRLIETFGDLETLYAEDADWTAAGIKPTSKMAERLKANRDQAFLFRRILRLDDSVPLSVPVSATRLEHPDRSLIAEAVDRRGLRRGLGATLATAMEGYGV